MHRKVTKSAPTDYLNLGFRFFPWLPKPASPRPPSDESTSWGSTVDADDEAQRGFDWETRYHKLPLTILGLWPYDSQMAHLKFLVCLVAITMYTLPSVARVMIDTSSGPMLDDLQADLAEVFPLLFTVTQYSVFRGKRSKVKTILDAIHENWRNSTRIPADEKKPMLVYGRKTRMVTALCMGFYLLSCVGYFGAPLIKMLSRGELSAKKLANHGVYPFPTNISPAYETVYALQALQGTLCALSITSVDGFLLLSTFHGCGQLSLLCKTICRYDGRTRHAAPLANDANQMITSDCSCLKCIVDRHVSLARYVETIDDIFNGIIMARLVMNTAHFCGIGYTIVKSNETSNFADVALNVIYMLTMTSNLFMYCWAGEQLLTKGEDVGKAVYNLHWCNMEAKVVQSLAMPIMRSRRPMQVTAGKFFVMSFGCYKEWFTKSMGYLSVLLAVKSYT